MKENPMLWYSIFTLFLLIIVSCQRQSSNSIVSPQHSIPLFDGETFKGWEGDTTKVWRIENGAIVAGSLDQTIDHNHFLATKKSYRDFTLRLKFKLSGSEGLVNAGVQFHSERLTDPPYEMIGYQADLGANYWGSLYDESRRDKTLVLPDMKMMNQILRYDDWNDYMIVTKDKHIQIYLNGQKTVDYIETDLKIPQHGHIALQIHGGGKTLVSYKEITIE